LGYLRQIRTKNTLIWRILAQRAETKFTRKLFTRSENETYGLVEFAGYLDLVHLRRKHVLSVFENDTSVQKFDISFINELL
jgi:hypothetical protein